MFPLGFHDQEVFIPAFTRQMLSCHNDSVYCPCTVRINRITIRSCRSGIHGSAVSVGGLLEIIAAKLAVISFDPVPSGRHSSKCAVRNRIKEVPSSIAVFKPACLHDTICIEMEPGILRLSCSCIWILNMCPCRYKILSVCCILKVPVPAASCLTSRVTSALWHRRNSHRSIPSPAG